MARYELLDDLDLPFPLGGCFGYWGYDLKNFVEPKLPRRAFNDLELPDCHVGFYDSLVAFDHRLGKTWIVSTGLDVDGSRSQKRAETQLRFWQDQLGSYPGDISESGSGLADHASPSILDASRPTPHAPRFTPHASRTTPHASRSTPH